MEQTGSRFGSVAVSLLLLFGTSGCTPGAPGEDDEIEGAKDVSDADGADDDRLSDGAELGEGSRGVEDGSPEGESCSVNGPHDERECELSLSAEFDVIEGVVCREGDECVQCTDQTISSEYRSCRIAFSTKSFGETYSWGFRGVSGAAGSDDGDMKLSVSLVDDTGIPISPASAEVLADIGLDGEIQRSDGEVHIEFPGPEEVDLGVEDVKIDNGRIYSAPDLRCGRSGEQDLRTCSNSGFECREPSGGEPRLARCQREANMEVSSVSFVGDPTADRYLGILVENGGSVTGLRPESLEGWYYDRDGDGRAEDQVGASTPGIASDPRAHRVSSLRSFVRPIRRVASVNADVETRPGLWTTSAASEPDAIRTSSDGSGWYDAWDGEDSWQSIAEDIRGIIGDGDASYRSALFENLASLLQRAYGSVNTEANLELVAVVDGPPEFPASARSVTASDVVQRAKDLGVNVTVVHYDMRSNPEKLLDDPAYYRPQETQCTSDDECLDWEECRTVRGYHPTTQDGDVTSTQGVWRDGKFCMPSRRSDGRTGPISAYGRLARETGGRYVYRRASSDLAEVLPRTPQLLPGKWSVIVEIEEAPSLEGPYRVGGEVTTTLGETGATFRHSQTGGNREANAPRSGDTRSVVFSVE